MKKTRSIDLAKLLCHHSLETLRQASPAQSAESAAGALARGQVFELVGYFDDASTCYEEALAIEPNLDEATARLALSQMKGGHIEKGLATITALTARNPRLELRTLASDELISPMTILGEALLAAGRLGDAQLAYEAAQTVNPNDGFANGRLAQIHLATGAPKKAFDLASSFAGAARFTALADSLALGKTSLNLLPVLEPRTLAASVFHSMPGRPLLVGGVPRRAPTASGSVEWSELPDLSQFRT